MKLPTRVLLPLKAAIAYIITLVFVFLSSAGVYAAQLDGVSVELSDPRPNQTGVSYTFDITSGVTATSAQCIDIVLNDASDGTGSAPTGIDTTGASIDNGATDAITGANWTENVAVNGRLRATYGTGEILTDPGDIVWTGIDNGSDTLGTTYFAIITTYTDACSTVLDEAVTAFVYTEGELVSLTLGPTITFTCAGVGSSADVWPNGNPGSESTTVASSSTSIDHGETVTVSTNGISAHDLSVSTNAASGYNVYIRHTGQLTSQSGATIADWTGSNATPTSFPAAGTEAWGYTTDDDDLVQFYGLDLWAGFPTATGTGGDVVMTGATATAATETVRVGHQVGIASSTAAGTYTTTIVYTIVATF